MKSTTILENIAYKLTYIGKQFLGKALLLKILAVAQANYDIKHLVQVWYISVIKRDTIYLNHLYVNKYVASETMIAYYCAWHEYMIGWLWLYNQYGRTTQQAQITIVYTTHLSGHKTIAGQKFLFYKKRPSFFRWKERLTKQWIKYYQMSRERACIQMILDSQGILEFQDDVILQIKKWIIDKGLITNLMQQYCSKSQQSLLASFLIVWSKK